MTEQVWVTDTSTDLDSWIKGVLASSLATPPHRPICIELRPGKPIVGAGDRKDVVEEAVFPLLVANLRSYANKDISAEMAADLTRDWNRYFDTQDEASGKKLQVTVRFHPHAHGPRLILMVSEYPS